MRKIISVTKQTASSKGLRRSPVTALVLAVSCLLGVSNIQAQSSSTTAAPGTTGVTASGAAALEQNAITKYDNRWDIYGGMLFMNGQAGQNLPKRYDMGGGELKGTYWLGSHFHIPSNHLGLAADYRFGAGTTPVLPQAAMFGLNRILVYQDIVTGGLEYRGPKNRYVGINFQALAGAAHGTFDTAITGYPKTYGNVPNGIPAEQLPTTAFVGVYSNRTSPWAAAGGSIDFNYAPKVAIRLQPDLIFEHYGTETREFFSISAGVVYRLGHLK